MKKQTALKNIEERLGSYLGLKHRLVGVKLINNNEDVKGSVQPRMPMAFCQMLRQASAKGDLFQYGLDHEKCLTAQRVLGFRDLEPAGTGEQPLPLETERVLVSPLSELHQEPDVILAVLTPRQMMDLTLVLREGGKPLLAEFSGERACTEFFAKPYLEHKPGVSLLCRGAREIYSDFRDDEIVFGAPFEVYVRAAETIERIDKMRGALCGCRASDLPTQIVNEFEKIGLSKGTDYFFGKTRGHNMRVYLNKDLNGMLKSVTMHLPVKMASEEDAGDSAARLKQSLPRTYSVNKRGYWVDITIRASEGELGIDLFDGLSVKAAIERFVENVTRYLVDTGRAGPNGEG